MFMYWERNLWAPLGGKRPRASRSPTIKPASLSDPVIHGKAFRARERGRGLLCGPPRAAATQTVRALENPTRCRAERPCCHAVRCARDLFGKHRLRCGRHVADARSGPSRALSTTGVETGRPRCSSRRPAAKDGPFGHRQCGHPRRVRQSPAPVDHRGGANMGRLVCGCWRRQQVVSHSVV